MKRYPTISIITPSYNQGRFIQETIESVLSQEGDFYLDYLIFDGASTDNSVDIIREYDRLLRESRYPVRCRGIKYRWISEPDRGQTHAINKGLCLVSGEFLAYLNSDDTYLSWTVQTVIKHFLQHPDVDMVYGDGKIINADSRTVRIEKKMPFSYKDLLRYSNFGGGNYISQPTVFWKKVIQTKVGFFNESLDYAMDYDFWLRFGKVGKIVYLPVTLANDRRWEGAKSICKEIEMRAEALQVCRRHLGGGITLARIRYFCGWIGHKCMGLLEYINSLFFKLLKKILGYTTYNKLRLNFHNKVR